MCHYNLRKLLLYLNCSKNTCPLKKRFSRKASYFVNLFLTRIVLKHILSAFVPRENRGGRKWAEPWLICTYQPIIYKWFFLGSPWVVPPAGPGTWVVAPFRISPGCPEVWFFMPTSVNSSGLGLGEILLMLLGEGVLFSFHSCYTLWYAYAQILHFHRRIM